MLKSKELSLPEDIWSMIIEPQRGLLDLRLRGLWGYHDLVTLFVRRDFVAAHKQTVIVSLVLHAV